MATRQPGAGRQEGFSYLVLLFAVAIAAAGLAGTGIVWHLNQQREKERELIFIGNQMRAAIASYQARTPAGAMAYPPTLDDLVKDKRFPVTVRHLRKVYRDPMTGTFEWGLIPAPGGGIMGIYSKSERRPIKRADFDLPNRVFEEQAKALGEKMTYRNWQFAHVAQQPGVPARVVRPVGAR